MTCAIRETYLNVLKIREVTSNDNLLRYSDGTIGSIGKAKLRVTKDNVQLLKDFKETLSSVPIDFVVSYLSEQTFDNTDWYRFTLDRRMTSPDKQVSQMFDGAFHTYRGITKFMEDLAYLDSVLRNQDKWKIDIGTNPQTVYDFITVVGKIPSCYLDNITAIYVSNWTQLGDKLFKSQTLTEGILKEFNSLALMSSSVLLRLVRSIADSLNVENQGVKRVMY